MRIEKVKLSDKFNAFSEHWSPKILGELNGQHVKIAKLKGEFVMHQHENEDELFLVIEGVLKIEMEEETITLEEGEFCIIPRGVNHKPIAEKEVKLLLFEPKTTLNTGDKENERTIRDVDIL